MLISQSMDDRNGAFVMMSFWMIWLLDARKLERCPQWYKTKKMGGVVLVSKILVCQKKSVYSKAPASLKRSSSSVFLVLDSVDVDELLKKDGTPSTSIILLVSNSRRRSV